MAPISLGQRQNNTETAAAAAAQYFLDEIQASYSVEGYRKTVENKSYQIVYQI